MPVNAQADAAPYNELLTAYAVQKGSGGAYLVDEFCPIVEVETQEFAIPQYAERVSEYGIVDTKAKGDGSLNVRTAGAPTFDTGKADRRGLKSFIEDETKASPNAALFADEQTEIDLNVEALRYESEIAFRDRLNAIGEVSGHYVVPSAKWDDTGDPEIIEVLETALTAAEDNTGISLESGNYRLIVPRGVADVVRAYLRVKRLYTDAEAQAGGPLPSVLANAPCVVPGARHNTAKMGQAASVSRIWTNDNVYIVYVDPAFARQQRTFTSFAQYRWNKVSPSFGVKTWRDPQPDIYRTWVAVDIYDLFHTVSQDGVYVVKNVLLV